MGKRIAVVLFNLGGPDSSSAVHPFLFNLFKDKAILRLPAMTRYPLAWLISSRRAKIAKHIYAQIGGKSPILEQTQAQASALQEALVGEGEYKIFTCMRYWKPASAEIVKQVKSYQPDQVILLPLYPQFSTTTTASSLLDWKKSAAHAGLKCKTVSLCCYPQQNGWIAAQAELIREKYWQMADGVKPHLLFSAHGLPKKIVAAGDPYQWQVEQTVAAIVKLLAIDRLEWSIAYQSRIGPLEWIGPSTEDEIRRTGTESKPLLVVPVAFVSEHSETLVEMDIAYRKLAEESGVPAYGRVPAVGVQKHFIHGLKALCITMSAAEGTCSDRGVRLCPRGFNGCQMETDDVG